MPDEPVVAIAPIPLARSTTRLLIAPVLLLMIAAGGMAAGVLLLEGWQLILAIAGSGLVVVLALYLAAVALSVRLDVEVSTLRLRWIGADRRYQLARGPVTRVPLTGERAARLRPRFGAFGWGLGPARLRGSETVQLVRLARSSAVILVPTEDIRVAIAPRSEQQLLDALTAAARVQQRLDQVASRARAMPIDHLLEAPRPAPPPVVARDASVARVLTGIERQLLEERLAAERAAAIAAAEAERQRAEEARLAAEAVTVTQAVVAEPRPAEPARRPRVRPRLPRMPRPRIAFPSIRDVPAARAISMGLAAVPLVGSIGVWVGAIVLGSVDPAAEELRQASIGLALAGPGAAVAALAARAWFPRLMGLVIVTSLCALILLGRALAG